MDLSKIPVGENPPYDVNALIEIPQGGEPVKYELDKDSGAIFVDRFLHTAMFYPGNYGFIPHTLADDGDPMDILVVGPTPVVPGAVIRCRPVGALIMTDEAGGDEKVLAVPVDQLHPFWRGVGSIEVGSDGVRIEFNDGVDPALRRSGGVDVACVLYGDGDVPRGPG